ncbi:MAG: UvrD-helicase domain-containing protein [Sulfuriferula sp.]
MPLTEEQEQALHNTGFALRAGYQHSVYVAYAGAGKTSILLSTADGPLRDDQVLIIAFNSSIVADVKPRLKPFKGRVAAMTSHQLALHSLPEDYRKRVLESLEAYNGVLQVPHIVDALEIPDSIGYGVRRIHAQTVASLAKRTLTRFCQSGDPTILPQHIPGRLSPNLQELMLGYAAQLWDAITSMRLPITHDAYFKLWQLSNPVIQQPYRMLDEAQDTNPALYSVLFAQRGGLTTWAGDPYQSIYAWRGANNAIAIASQKPDTIVSRLTRSFRFGDETASLATRLLSLIGEQHPVRGTGSTKVQLAPDNISPAMVAGKTGATFAWIAFTNASLVLAALSCIDHGIPFHIVGQGREQLRLLSAAQNLKDGIFTPGSPLSAYSSWEELKEEALVEPGGEASKLVGMAKWPGFGRIIASIRQSKAEKDARVVLTTAHAAKGREWDLVVLDPDLDATKDKGGRKFFIQNGGRLHYDDIEDIHLRYVAITRARKRLVIACPVLYQWLTR